MLSYYVIYKDEGRSEPRGIFIVEVDKGGALLWNHRRGGWAYDPDLVMRFLADYRNMDRYQNVQRQAAEEFAPGVTQGGLLPSEADIQALLEEGRRSVADPRAG